VQPNQTGVYSYTFNVIDNFGCPYDTTVAFVVLPLANIFDDTIACNDFFQVSGTTAFNGGVWTAVDPAIGFSNATSNNPIVVTSIPGIYEVVFTDNQCNYSDTGRIEFPPKISVGLPDTTLCQGTSYTITPVFSNNSPTQNGYNPTIDWSWDNGNPSLDRLVTDQGNYVFYINNYCYATSDTTTLTYKPCDIEVPNILVLSSLAGNNAFFVDYSGIAKFNCIILNRWGNVIYEYDDPAGIWDGKTSGGKLVEEGTYFYKINATFEGGKEVEKHGFVVLKY
jgi:hypothetical protein